MSNHTLTLTSAYIPNDVSALVSSASFGDAVQAVDNFRLVLNAGSDRRAGVILQQSGQGYYEGTEFYKEFSNTFSDAFFVPPGQSIWRMDIVALGATPTFNIGETYENQGRIADPTPSNLSEIMLCMRTFIWPRGTKRSISVSMV